MTKSEEMYNLFKRAQELPERDFTLWLCSVYGVMKRHTTNNDVIVIEESLRDFENINK